jgi:uncharacterized membrane-anchored protein YhcB (DUF1043 family)
MKKIFAGFILPLLIICFTSLNSCKSCTASKQQKTAEKQEVKEIQSQIETHIYPLPTSASVIKKLTELEVGYIIGLTNPVENSKKYFDSQSRAKNLGAFGADLSYVTLYNQQQDVINYLDVIKSLSNELNMSKVYNEDLYTQIKQNVDNKDELVKILTKEFNDTYAFLSDNDQQPLALLVVGGAWVEGMYLTTHVSEAAYQNPEFSRVLLDQKKSFETYLEITKPYLTDASVADFVKLLDPVSKVYDGLGTSLTEQNIKDITKVIVDLREKVVK